MRLSSVFAAGAALVVIGTSSFAQATPPATATPKVNFAGKWVIIPDTAAPAAAGRGMAMGPSTELTIAQDEKAVTVTRTMAQVGELKTVFNFDGTETYTTLAFGNAGGLPLTAKAKWGEKDKFLTTTSASYNGTSFDITMNLSIDAGGNLIVESSMPSGGGGAPATTVSKYKKG